VDDLRKVRGEGLSPGQKLWAQSALALVGAWVLRRQWGLDWVYVPFAGDVSLGAGWPFFGALVLVAASNAVNLADGVDGLAPGAAGLSSIFFLLLALATGLPGVSITSMALLGACLGVLVYNLPPARLHLGDSGALGAGALLGCIAMASRAEWLLVLAGGIFVLDALSVAVQAGAAKLVTGPVRLLRHQRSEIYRPLLIAPIHHHFQMLGWTDWKVVGFFWSLQAFLACLAAVALLLHGDIVWGAGAAVMILVIGAASLQKLFSESYFLGLYARGASLARQTTGGHEQAASGGHEGEHEPELALYRGLPAQVFGAALYRAVEVTVISQSQLSPLALESLWRRQSEIEARVMLGKIFAYQRLYDDARRQWEMVPARNLGAREDALCGLVKIYHSHDEILKAVMLLEQVPQERLASSQRLRGEVRRAKLRLVHLARRAHEQSIRSLEGLRRGQGDRQEVVQQLERARRLNQDLFSLLVHEREKLESPLGKGRQAEVGQQRRLYRNMEVAVLKRLEELDAASQQASDEKLWPVERPHQPEEAGVSAAGPPARGAGADESQVSAKLGMSPGQIAAAMSGLGGAGVSVVRVEEDPSPSRNAIYRLWFEADPSALLRFDLSDSRADGLATAIAKVYEVERITFFQECYERERNLLEKLASYGCHVPKVYGGSVGERNAVLFMEDVGGETLAEGLQRESPGRRLKLLEAAVKEVAHLHGTARQHIEELQEQILKADKEVLREGYYVRAFRIGVERLAECAGVSLDSAELDRLDFAVLALARTLAMQPKTFIHFEFTPHHLLVEGQRMTVFDFEQATLGPPEFDLATMLRNPECELDGAQVQEFADAYHREIREMGATALPPRDPETFDYAAVLKNLTLAGSAANFYKKYGGDEHLGRMRWYLSDCMKIAERHAALHDLARSLEEKLGRALAVG
jgi:UDP-N-acetylmuramyl pentapeptide phosphotransferase/UDP-N-acetylglucosamine-1-phosphate transferase/aminoglycoside/choline kinase family phosphotransferase